ncbi:MAG TPA: hypothetical protein VHC45_13485 [Gaiellaceae bacterium]|nr:hypothetical protein [Gaiellaceae bacterium]
MIEPLDLGVCRGYGWRMDAERLAVVLPGRLLAGMPSVSIPIYALLDRGWGAVQVWDEAVDPEIDESGWVRERVEAALAVAGDRAALLVAKSMSTRAAGIAGERSLPAVWLTPLLHDPVSVAWLRARTAPALLVGGTADPAWDGALARELSDDVLELPGADHGFGGPDGVRSLLANLGRIAAAVDAFAGRL